MSAHLERARLLLAQSRPADAEREVHQALAAAPHDPSALAILALIRSELSKVPEALAAAEEAIGLAPDAPGYHYVHAFVLHHADRQDDAFQAIQEACRLDPSDADYFGLLAGIELARQRPAESLAAAETALSLDPESTSAANLRAMALVRLGRKAEAFATTEHALGRNPNDPLTHANQGWNFLHGNKPKEAQVHFAEALRLDPNCEYAREGMLSALKARNPVYRAMLAYFLFASRQGRKIQWALILGIWFGTRTLWRLAETQQNAAWFWWSLVALLYAFVYLTWTAQPMFNLMLRLDRFGRHVLSDDQRVGSNWFAAAFALALIGLAWFISDPPSAGFDLMFVAAALSICLGATFNTTGDARRKLAWFTGILAGLGTLSFVIALVGSTAAHNGSTLLFVLGFVGFQFYANAVTR